MFNLLRRLTGKGGMSGKNGHDSRTALVRANVMELKPGGGDISEAEFAPESVGPTELESIIFNELPEIQKKCGELEKNVTDEELIFLVSRDCRGNNYNYNRCGERVGSGDWVCGYHFFTTFLEEAARFLKTKKKVILGLSAEELVKIGFVVDEFYQKDEGDFVGREITRKYFTACFGYAKKTGQEKRFFEELMKHKIDFSEEDMIILRESDGRE